MLQKIIVGIFLLSLFFVIIQQGISPSFIPGMFSECTGHKKGNYHTHSTLQIIQGSQQIPIPANIGIRTGCIHPLHTHDSTGLIHMDYPLKIRFTLGNFFDRMGVVFKDHEVGALKEHDGYKFQLYLNGKQVRSEYRNLVLRDRDRIKIVIDSP